MPFTRNLLRLLTFSIMAVLLFVPSGRADIITDWNRTANDIVIAAKLLPGPANRTITMIQTAVFEAVNAITRKYPSRLTVEVPASASVEAAVAAANRSLLAGLVPSQTDAIEKAYQEALASIKDESTKKAGIEIGEKAAAAVILARSDDKITGPENYRPYTAPAVYVPTVIPVFTNWPQRKPWVMTSPDQFRPGPPPDLKSDIWARDYNEILALGVKKSAVRSQEQTAIAEFWAATGPAIYYPLLNAVDNLPGRDITRNARLYAAVSQAMDDALIAVFDAKYHYNFWRPVTAIRNGDIDGNDATSRDEFWTPFIETPMHPEYPCAHCIVAAAVGTVLHAELGNTPEPVISTTSPAAPGVVRSWNKIDDFIKEVSEARICDGVHFRNSTEVGSAMGAKIGKLAAEKMLR